MIYVYVIIRAIKAVAFVRISLFFIIYFFGSGTMMLLASTSADW